MAELSCIPKLLKQTIILGWIAEDLKLMLLTNLHVPNAETQQYVSDVVENEVIDSNDVYTAGGVVLSNLAALQDPNSPANYALDANDVTIGPGTTLTYRFGIIYRDMGTGNHAVNPIKAQVDFLEDQIIVNGTTTITWNELGIIYIS